MGIIMIHNLILFGATGSIGTNTLNVIRRNREKFNIIGISACSNFQKLSEIAHEFGVKNIGIWDSKNFHSQHAEKLFPTETHFFENEDGLCELAQHSQADAIIMAITGINGILPTLSAIKSRKIIMLASKEILVAAGSIVMNTAKEYAATILPIDSEHNAIFQCLRDERKFLKKIILTASGGPFRNYTTEQMVSITVEEALRHPNWEMGKKITIDSATMVNKGFEMIEAKWLFELSPQNIEIIIHFESIIHSMIEFCDGSILAQLSPHNMEYPISNCLFYPERAYNNPSSLNLHELSSLTFSSPDYSKFPCLKISQHCLAADDHSSAIFLAANDVAVQAFLNKKIRYIDIANIISNTLDKYHPTYKNSIEYILNIISEARNIAQTEINNILQKNLICSCKRR